MLFAVETSGAANTESCPSGWSSIISETVFDIPLVGCYKVVSATQSSITIAYSPNDQDWSLIVDAIKLYVASNLPIIFSSP